MQLKYMLGNQISSEIISNNDHIDSDLPARMIELEELEIKLLDMQFFLSETKSELNQFNKKYIQTVSVLYAQLDDVIAEIAEFHAKKKPQNTECQKEASILREKAKASASESKLPQNEISKTIVQPTDSLKNLYREAAKRFHPDFAISEDDRELRHKVMAQVNSAYEFGDEAGLKKILDQFFDICDRNEDLMSKELSTVLFKIATIKSSIETIQSEIDAVLKSDLFILYKKYKHNILFNKDILLDMAASINHEIAAKKNLLKKLNESNETL
jgi:phage terminase small subunit